MPVVKDFVAEWYEGHKDNLDFEIYNFCCDLFKTKSEFATWFGNAENNSISTLIKMKDGYTVEKPQLFYLKNKMTGLNLVLEQFFNATGKHVGERFREFNMQYIATDEQEARLYKNTFSKAEINNMDAGSYEQIKVEGGE
ncbi:DUF1642 domain-containing protein [Lactococcus lactis]|uniref:DUF1642 domain-containing protein n=1 Tax=Lactococcus lactis TaxID=1358 RepID=UPI0031F62E8D